MSAVARCGVLDLLYANAYYHEVKTNNYSELRKKLAHYPDQIIAEKTPLPVTRHGAKPVAQSRRGGDIQGRVSEPDAAQRGRALRVSRLGAL